MLGHVEAFGQEEAEEDVFPAVSGDKYVVGYGEKSGFRGQAEAEAVMK